VSIAGRYLSRLFFAYFAVALVVLVGPLLSLDLMEHGGEIMAAEERSLALGRYAALRLPGMAAQLAPIAALVAGLLMVEGLRRHRELVALWNTGLSPWRIMAAMLPVGVLLLGLQLVLDDRAVPAAAAELRAWAVGPYEGEAAAAEEGADVWLLSGDHVLRVAAVSGTAERLEDVTVFRRDAEGNLLERLDARAARRVDDHWLLRDVVRRPVGSAAPERVAGLPWTAPIDPKVISMLSVEPRELRLSIIYEIVVNEGFGRFETDVYRVWLHERLANALAPMLMIALAVSLVRGEHIRRGPGLFLVAGMAIGFGYFIYDGVVLAIGKAGWLPAWFAAWSPKALMACVIATLALRA